MQAAARVGQGAAFVALGVGSEHREDMACCSTAGAQLARKQTALEATPFFASLVGPDGAPLLEQIARDAVLRKVKSGDALDDINLGTFVVVVEGELVHTELKMPGSPNAKRGSGATGKIACESSTRADTPSKERSEVLATRKAGDFFRLAGSAGGGKAAKLADLSRVIATQRSLILLLTPNALSHALTAGHGGSEASESTSFSSIIKEMIKEDLATIISKVPVFAPLDKRVRSAVAQLFSYDVVQPRSTVFTEGEKGDWFCILLHGELEVYQGGNKVAVRGPPAFLGEIALLYNCERTASIKCGDAAASVLSLRAEHFQRILDRVPDMREQVESLQRSRIVYSVMKFCKQYTSSDTEESTKAQCEAIAKHVEVRLVQAGQASCIAQSTCTVQAYKHIESRPWQGRFHMTKSCPCPISRALVDSNLRILSFLSCLSF